MKTFLNSKRQVRFLKLEEELPVVDLVTLNSHFTKRPSLSKLLNLKRLLPLRHQPQLSQLRLLNSILKLSNQLMNLSITQLSSQIETNLPSARL